MKNAILAKGINLMLCATTNKKQTGKISLEANWKNISMLTENHNFYPSGKWCTVWFKITVQLKKKIKLYERSKGNIIKDYKTVSWLVGQAHLFTSYHYTRGPLLTLEAWERENVGLPLTVAITPTE